MTAIAKYFEKLKVIGKKGNEELTNLDVDYMKYILEVTSRWAIGEESLDPRFIPDGAKQEYVTIRRYGEVIRNELRWVIELNTLEELERLAKWGQSIYGSLDEHNGQLVIIYESEIEYPIIEFYNDYRE